MKHAVLYPLALILTLSACKEEIAQDVSPVALTANAIDHYCQMNLVEHAGPKGQVHLEGLPAAPLFFSQVRDLVAYARMPEQDHRILALWVNDMGAAGASWDQPGAANWIDAKTAYYVIGSGMEGGMGADELVPFADPARANAFAGEHGGQVISYDDIPLDAVLPPDEETPLADDPDFQNRLKALDRHSTEKGA